MDARARGRQRRNRLERRARGPARRPGRHSAARTSKEGDPVRLLVAAERPAQVSRDVKAEHISDWTNTGDLTAVEALFANLDTQDADLIVAGAFGHSRIYEGLFGGVTLDLMHQQSLPVLMSH